MNDMNNKLTPTEELICDVLAARLRLGETMWTFDTKLTSQATHLAELGLIGTTHGIVEKTFRAWLTEAGVVQFLDEDYVLPADRGRDGKEDKVARHSRIAEGYVKSALGVGGVASERLMQAAQVHANLAKAARR